MDDGRNVVDILSNGVRYNADTKEFMYKEEWDKEDKESGVSHKKRTEVEVRKLMNSINSDLKFTTESEVDFENGKLPTLSFQLWSEYEGIRHTYFEKEMRAQVLTMQKSSQGEQSKISILVNELVRRFEVMDDKLEIGEQIKIIDHFTTQLKNSGYSYKESREIVTSALKGIVRKKENRKGELKRYKSSGETLESRIQKKLLEASTWFKDREKESCEKSQLKEIDKNHDNEREMFKENNKSWRNWRISKRNGEKRIIKNIQEKYRRENQRENYREKKIEGVLFIQHTKHSELAKLIRERLKVIEKVGLLKVKIVERTGDKLVDLLHKSNAWGNEDCQRPDCWLCSSAGEEGPKGACKQRSVLYETYCETCGEIEKVEEEEIIIENTENPIKRKRNQEDKTNVKKKRKRIDYKVKYIGESWRSAYERGNEHQLDLQYLREGSHMLKHIIEDHPGKKINEVKFGMRVVRKFKSALERQVSEAVSIHRAQSNGYKLLNSKSEYSRCVVPRLKVETNSELLETLLGEKEREKIIKEKIRSLNKRKKDPLSTICEEIIADNNKKWKRRRLDNVVYMRNRENEEKILLEKEKEKKKRLELAEKKKSELIRKLKQKGELRITGKSIEWVKRKQQLWRKFRESVGLNSDDEEDLRREIVSLIPERKPIFDAEKLENGVNLKTTVILRKSLFGNNVPQLSSGRLSLAQRTQDIEYPRLDNQREQRLENKSCDKCDTTSSNESQDTVENLSLELE